MHKFQKILVAVTSAAMILGTMGVAGAAKNTTATSKGWFLNGFEAAIGTTLTTSTTSSFSDVSTSAPNFKAIQTAYENGWVAGVGGGKFDPTAPINIPQICKIEALALDLTVTPGAMPTWKDTSMIPAWADAYCAAVQAAGLIKGNPVTGDVNPYAPISAARNAALDAQAMAYTPTTLALKASSTDVAVGQQVTLSSNFKNTTYAITSSNASTAVVSGTSFIASAPGNYTITGTAGTQTATITISVYGAAVGLQINVPSTVVANDASSNTVTVDVVDANGNIVANNTDSITLTSGNTGVLQAPATSPVPAVDGVATFTLTSGTEAGVADTLTAADANNTAVTGNGPYTATVTATAQAATSISVTAGSAYVENNDGKGTDTFTAQVLDQTGNPMISGVYGITFNVAGSTGFTFTGGTTSTTNAYVGSSTPTTASATVDVAQAAAGTITVTASTSVAGISSGSATATAVQVGNPVALKVTASASSATADAVAASTSSAPVDTLTITAVDANGYPTASSESVKVTESLGGSPSSNLNLTSGTASLSNGSVTVGVYGNATPTADVAGTYTFTVSDNGTAGLTGTTTTLAVTPGAPADVTITSPTTAQYVGLSNPTATITAQVTDAEGNNVADQGASLTFSLASGNTAEATLSPGTATTGANGSASTTLTFEPYTGNAYTVSVAATGLTAVKATSAPITLEATVPTSLKATLLDSSTNGTIATAGDSVTLTVYGYDQYGAQTGSDYVTITPSAGLDMSAALGGKYNAATNTYTVQLSGGTASITGIATSTAGTQTVSVVDDSNPAVTTGAGVTVTPAAFNGFVVVDSQGNALSSNHANNYLSFTPGTPVELTLEAVDSYGNISPSSVTETVYLYTSGSGVFSTSTAAGSEIGSNGVTFQPGQTTMNIYYTSTGTAPSYDDLTAK